MIAVPEPFAPDPTALDRAIELELVFNLRDLGGLPTANGDTVRRGQVFRADGVHRLAGDDLEKVRQLKLRTVIDLRTEAETRLGRFPVEEHPVEWHHLPVLRRIWSDDDLYANECTAAEFLRDRYLDMLVHGGDSIAAAVRVIAAGAPALFHCAAGKDRTGVVAAMVLGLLEVPADEIVDDYHASVGAVAAFTDWQTVERPEAMDAMTSQPPEYLEAPPEAMRGFLEHVEARYGSLYDLARHLGVEAHVISELRRNLTE